MSGSPPLARGKENAACGRSTSGRITPACAGKSLIIGLLPVQRGITPACAGKSGQEWGSYWGKRDHPRLRGEKLPRKQLRRQLLGSPPLARGKVCSILKASPYYRITPACAGKERWNIPLIAAVGSPPLARGKAFLRLCTATCLRITPACAGKSGQADFWGTLT